MENVVDMQHEDLQGAFVRLGYDVSSDQDFIGGYVHWSDDESKYAVELVRASDWKENATSLARNTATYFTVPISRV